MTNKELGKKMEALRKNAGFTQQQAATKVGKSKSALSMWENGVNEPSIIAFIDLLCFYGVKEAEELRAVLLNKTPKLQPKPFAFCPYCGEKLNK